MILVLISRFYTGNTKAVTCANSLLFHLREDSSGTGGVPKYKKKIIKENGGYNGDFLTLAPPIPKDPPSYLGYYIPELPDFDSLPYQVRDRVTLPLFLYTIISAQVI